MASQFDDFKSKDPAVAELARGFNKLYLTNNDLYDCRSTFNELKPKTSIHVFLIEALKMRELIKERNIHVDGLSYEQLQGVIEGINPKTNILSCILAAMHDSKIISLDPSKRFMVLRKGSQENNVQIGERWRRLTPHDFKDYNPPVGFTYHANGTAFEKYLTLKLNEYDIKITFADGICYLNPQNIIKTTANKMLFKYDNNDFSLVSKLIPQIVPDIVIAYIDLTMVIPRKPQIKSKKLKYNQVQRALNIDYNLKPDLPVYHKDIVKYITQNYPYVAKPAYGNVLPTKNIGLLLENDAYINKLAPELEQFEYPN